VQKGGQDIDDRRGKGEGPKGRGRVLAEVDRILNSLYGDGRGPELSTYRWVVHLASPIPQI